MKTRSGHLNLIVYILAAALGAAVFISFVGAAFANDLQVFTAAANRVKYQKAG